MKAETYAKHIWGIKSLEMRTDMKPSFCHLLKTIQILPSVIITQSELYLNTALVWDWTCERVTVRLNVFLGAAVGQGRFKLSQEHRAHHCFLCVDGDHSVRIIQGHRHQDQTSRTHCLTGKPGNTHRKMDWLVGFLTPCQLPWLFSWRLTSLNSIKEQF